MRWARYVAPMGRWETHTEYSWGNLKKIRVIGRPVERWKNIKMDLKLIWRAWIGVM
jgi:hypothetical protein